MQRELYVGNLGYRVGDEELGRLFSGYGTVRSAEVVHYHNCPRSAGFGFVEMKTEEQSGAAIASLNGQRYGGHVLTVDSVSFAEGVTLRSICRSQHEVRLQTDAVEVHVSLENEKQIVRKMRYAECLALQLKGASVKPPYRPVERRRKRHPEQISIAT